MTVDFIESVAKSITLCGLRMWVASITLESKLHEIASHGRANENDAKAYELRSTLDVSELVRQDNGCCVNCGCEVTIVLKSSVAPTS